MAGAGSAVPRISPRKVTEVGKGTADKLFGSRPVERVQLARPFESREVQERIEILASKGYTLITVTAEKVSKDYIGLGDPEQATSRLGGNDGQLVTTLYFQRIPKKK